MSNTEQSLTQALANALEAGASVMFTWSGARCTVTIQCEDDKFTGHGENAATALSRALAALPAG